MARIRSVKPEHWNDKELPNISLSAHLLWIGMWNFSDDDGVIEADPLLIRSQVFPRRTDIRTEQMEQWIGQLVKARFVIPFEYNGSGYYIHRTFKTHQKIEKPKPSNVPKSVIESVLSKIPDKSPTNPRQVADESPTSQQLVGAGEERKGIGEEGRGEDAHTRDAPMDVELEGVIWDIETWLKNHEKHLEAVCVDTRKDKNFVFSVLKKFHLWNVENEKYPKKPIPLIAGLKKWILNENKGNNGTAHKSSNSVGSPVVQNVHEAGTRGF